MEAKFELRSSPENARIVERAEALGGLAVLHVDAGSVADRAGLRRGDVLMTVAGDDVRSLADYRRTIARLRDAHDRTDAVRMEIVRAGLLLEVALATGWGAAPAA
ncbi:MAG: PDZ domain-containing protein [Myxococcota bacterium]